MTNARSLIALAVLAASATLAVAQSVPANRADVKADAKAAVKAGTTDEGNLTTKGPGRVTKAEITSDKSRSEVKSDAKAAVKAGTTAEGEKGGPAYGERDKNKPITSTESRSDVKQEAKAAVKAGTTAEGEKGGPVYSGQKR